MTNPRLLRRQIDYIFKFIPYFKDCYCWFLAVLCVNATNISNNALEKSLG